MENLTLGFEVSVDESTGKVRAAYLRVREGGVAETKEIAAGKAYADYDQGGCLVSSFSRPARSRLSINSQWQSRRTSGSSCGRCRRANWFTLNCQ